MLTLVLGVSILVGAIKLTRKLWDDPKGQTVLRGAGGIAAQRPAFVINFIIWLLIFVVDVPDAVFVHRLLRRAPSPRSKRRTREWSSEKKYEKSME